MHKKKIILLAAIAALLVTVPLAWFGFRQFQLRSGESDYSGDAAIVGTTPPIIQGEPSVNGVTFNESMTIAPTALGDITITAMDETHFGIATHSAFLISSAVNTLTMEHLHANLSMRSGESFTLEAQPDNAFLLRFDDELESNRVYNLLYAPPGRQAASHAFQTQDIFRVTATSPADHTHGIPNDAGIEVTFSREIAGDFAGMFRIEPPVEGRFLQRGNTHIFAPFDMDFNTLYTVTISQGLESVYGDVLTEDYVFSFTTRWGTSTAPLFSIAGNEYETFLPWNEAFIALNVSNDFRGREFHVSLYDLETPDHFIHFNENTPKNLVDTFELELAEFQTDHQSFFYLFLGRTLPEGYYVAQVRSTENNVDVVLHKFIQVSAISVYSLSLEGEAVFWVHDATTGQPAAGAEIIIDGDVAGTTNSDGLAIIETANRGHAAITITYGNFQTFAYTKPTFTNRPLIAQDRFLSYMYTDRPTYRPTDTVDVFGVIMPRYGQSHLPDDVFTLRFGDMLELPITLDAFHSFAMRVPVENMFGGTNIEVTANGERLMSTWVNFFDYTNLNYVITGELDRIAYFTGEYAQAEIVVTTFTGQPREGVSLRSGFDETEVTLTTNHVGIATGSVRVQDSWSRHWAPSWSSYWFSVISAAQVSQSISLPKIIVPRDIMMEHEFDGDTATITTNRIDIDRMNAHFGTSDMWLNIDPDIFRGDAVDVDFTVNITRHETTRTIRRQQYDHINRRMITTYDFDTAETILTPIHGRTENGRAVLTDLPTSNDPLISYSITITYNDSRGYETDVWLIDRRWWFPTQESSIRHFGLLLENHSLRINETAYVSLIEGVDQWHGWWGSPGFDDGFTPITEGRLLTVLVRDGIMDISVGSPAGTPITFTEAGISSALLFGAFFDGQYIFSISHPVHIAFDHTQRDMDIALTFDQDIYQPGDEVTVTVNALPNTQVLISVVDESSILHPWHNTNFMARFYHSSPADSWRQNFFQFLSHTQHNFGGAGFGAEGGGGGDGGGELVFRDTFVDNPIFEFVQTDSSGVGTLTFTLPDQITSWRVTAIGLTQDGYGGDAVYHVISTLDFYVDVIYTNEFIVGDDIAVLARAFGNDGASVEFTFYVLQDGEAVHTSTQTNHHSVILNAGKLDAGEYIMRIIARHGSVYDAVEHPFSVAESGMILPSRAAFNVTADSSGMAAPSGFGAFDPTQISMRPLPVRVSLTNANMRPLANILQGIRGNGSFRTDYIAADAFIDYFFTGVEDFDHARAQIHAQDGGIPQLTYEYPDFFYTARFAASFPEFVNRQQIIRFVDEALNGESGQMIRAARLLALAAVGEPVLLDIRAEIDIFVNTGGDHLTWLYLAAALVAVGDDAGAATLMQSFPHPSQLDLPQMHIEDISTLLLFINTTINPQAAWEHLRRDGQNQYVSDVPERVNFVRRARVLGENVSEIQYDLNGTTHTVRLEDFDIHHLHLSHAQFDALNLTPVSGSTDMHLDFYSASADNWLDADNRIALERTISREGDVIRVEIRANMPNDARGMFTIYDRLPSNMRFVPLRNDDIRNQGFARNIQRQLVEIRFFHDPEHNPQQRVLVYHAMELFEAEMANDTTFITNHRTENHLWGMTP